MNNYKIIPYLSFNGDCEKAVNAYIRAFGGKILYLSRWDEENCEKNSQIGKVMHTGFLLGETQMAAGDDFEGEAPNKAMKLMIPMESEAEARQSMETLGEGGEIVAPLSLHPEPDDAGMGGIVTDKYGFTRIITCPNPAKQIDS